MPLINQPITHKTLKFVFSHRFKSVGAKPIRMGRVFATKSDTVRYKIKAKRGTKGKLFFTAIHFHLKTVHIFKDALRRKRAIAKRSRKRM